MGQNDKHNAKKNQVTGFDNIWFTSDEHYFHKNIIRFCARPYEDEFIMNKALIDEHNKVVGDKDIVFHLGDFTFKSQELAFDIIKQLNGQHVFIRGNHDYWTQTNENRLFEDIVRLVGPNRVLDILDYKEIFVGKNHLCLFHFPMLTWHKGSSGSIHLHGHCHGNVDQKNIDDNVKRIDVGVDSAFKVFGEYRPFHIDEVLELVKDRARNTIDFGA